MRHGTPLFGLALVLALWLAGCADAKAAEIRNGGFEQGDQDWYWLDWSPSWLGPFEITNRSHSGEKALRTHARSDANHTTGIAGAVQNMSRQQLAGRLPDQLRFFVRADAWNSSADRAYIQVVFGFYAKTDEGQMCRGLSSAHPCQVAFLLGGIDRAPFQLGNRRFVVIEADRPELGRWVPFDIPVREHVKEQWSLREDDLAYALFYVETRYESNERPAPSSAVELDVSWDDFEFR